MKVLVTGATGFVGRTVANAIVDAGHEVRVLERKPGSWRKAGIRCQEAVQGDMTDADSLRRAVEGQEVVVHLVAIRQGKSGAVPARSWSRARGACSPRPRTPA